jgi:hypothetical protein
MLHVFFLLLDLSAFLSQFSSPASLPNLVLLMWEVMWPSTSLGSATLIIMMFVVCISSFYYDFVRRTFWDTKTCARMTRFRNAWKASHDRNPEAVSQLAQRCKEICGVLSQQRDDALQTLGLFGKVQAYLDERVGRWWN